MKCSRPLIAAGASPFALKQKDQKFKTEKTFHAQASSRPGFPSGLCPLFILLFALLVMSFALGIGTDIGNEAKAGVV